MIRPLVGWTSVLVAAGLLMPVWPSQASTPPSQANVVLPASPDREPVPNPQLQNSFHLESNPSYSRLEPDVELPASEDSQVKPLYQIDPLPVEDRPLRLEISLSRRRVGVFKGKSLIKSYPIAVGRPGWETPLGTYQVRQMLRNPTWIHPLKKGISIPGGDPENPLGRFWIGFWTDGKNWIGFHGTPNPKSVGTAASHGCIRMYNKDVEELFQKVSLGTEVKVVK
jgi:lipoprotein-anchoring transpeptidase ErfK/SrfK